MATRKPKETEIMDIPEDDIIKVDTGSIPVVSISIDTSEEALTPDPVPATEHTAFGTWQPLTVAPRKYENLLPIASTVLASVVTGSVLVAVGIIIGAGL